MFPPVSFLETKRVQRTMIANLSSSLFLLLEVVVVDFDGEDDDATNRCDEVRKHQRPDDVGLVNEPLNHESDAANSHHQEGWKRDSISVSSANGLIRLRQVTQNQSYACHNSANVEKNTLFHLYMLISSQIYEKISNL